MNARILWTFSAAYRYTQDAEDFKIDERAFSYLKDHLDSDKHWWPQAEAMIRFFNAFQISGDEKYLDYSMNIWRFIQEKLIDHKYGEWYWRVDQDGKLIETEDKAGFWKCPYHNSRGCLEIIERIDSMSLNLR